VRPLQLCTASEVAVHNSFLGDTEGLSGTLDTFLITTTVFYTDLPRALQTFWRPWSLISHSGKWVPRDFVPTHVHLANR
jgi:hypothetical protein